NEEQCGGGDRDGRIGDEGRERFEPGNRHAAEVLLASQHPSEGYEAEDRPDDPLARADGTEATALLLDEGFGIARDIAEPEEHAGEQQPREWEHDERDRNADGHPFHEA